MSGCREGKQGKRRSGQNLGRASGSKEAGEAPHDPQQTPASREGWEVEHAVHRAQEGGSVHRSSPGSNRENRGPQRESREKEASSPGGRRSPTQCAGLGEELLAQEAPFKGKPTLAPLLEHARTLRNRSLSRPPEDTCLEPDSPVNPLNEKQTQRLQRPAVTGGDQSEPSPPAAVGNAPSQVSQHHDSVQMEISAPWFITALATQPSSSQLCVRLH
ncbi:uncharacterized protein LOC126960730 [Macaca thibetana thibetana]|uniref:uncharacterized protein LOC126960730 n=1 Tax=Macaca thibetana thibetana TaxID=257877 RepID=UPI0021BCF759|nr:uncharacterized protein LOC126960730 [Macaca thibetana thibetana]